jgi:Ca2+-binding RTX toxin-like protein
MALSSLHTNWTSGSYFADRNSLIKPSENGPLYEQVTNGQQGQTFAVNSSDSIRLGLQPYRDDLGGGRFSLAVGYGFDLYKNSVSDIVAFLSQVGVTLSSADINALNNRNSLSPSQLQSNLSFTLGNEITASNLMGLYLEQRAEAQLDAALGYHLAESKERAALISLVYSGGTGIIGPNLRAALAGDNRAEAWYEIRYQSNGDGIHADRRIAESNLFSLYDNPGQGVGEAEAKEVLRMYTTHRTVIQAYESQFSTQFALSGTATIQFQLIGAETTLIALYAEGRMIDGEVLVGADEVLPGDRLSGTANNDLVFGENGHDILKGEAGDDVILGGAGTDQLTGGTGNDYLDGGQGYDTYVYRINDGQDTIRDADGKGSVFYDGKLVAGGVHTVDDAPNTYRSLDGTFTFVQSGTDLIVNNLITIKNYTSGNLGIQLTDAPATSTQAPPTFRTISGDFLPLDTDVVEEGVQIGFDDLGNIIQDPASPSDWQDTLRWRGSRSKAASPGIRRSINNLSKCRRS